MTEDKEEDVFFVGVQDPVELRRSILESSKDLLHYLQRFEKFKEVRLEKQEQLIMLKNVTGEIKTLVRKLKAELPKTHLRTRLHMHEEEARKEAAAEKKKATAKKKAVKKGKKAEKPVKKAVLKPADAEKPKTDLEKLEAELGAIETKLTRMT